jgi:hypothetical protein
MDKTKESGRFLQKAAQKLFYAGPEALSATLPMAQRTKNFCAAFSKSGYFLGGQYRFEKARRRVDCHGRLDRHSRCQSRCHSVRAIEKNFYRQALDDLHEIPSGIFGRQKGEIRAGAALEAVDAIPPRCPDRA